MKPLRTPKPIREMARLWAETTDMSFAEIARRCGVEHHTIVRWSRREDWDLGHRKVKSSYVHLEHR